MTIGVDFHKKIITIGTKEGPISCKLQLWVISNQERFRFIRSRYYRKLMGAILVFDLTK
jgi:GTPase SAR1 family protein